MQEQFKPGDVVRLKSGGPTMTVRWVDADEVSCDWFDNNKPQTAVFHPSQLQLV